jgi:hypothetical protein
MARVECRTGTLDGNRDEDTVLCLPAEATVAQEDKILPVGCNLSRAGAGRVIEGHR